MGLLCAKHGSDWDSCTRHFRRNQVPLPRLCESRRQRITRWLRDAAERFVDGDHRHIDAGLGLRDRILRV
jgi:hypothetical protein